MLQERKAAARTQQELQYQVDKLRKERKDLECQLGGVDMVRVQAESEEVARLRETLQMQQAASHARVADLERKLQWYEPRCVLCG